LLVSRELSVNRYVMVSSYGSGKSRFLKYLEYNLQTQIKIQNSLKNTYTRLIFVPLRFINIKHNNLSLYDILLDFVPNEFKIRV
jgi:hypothetical protein